MLRKLLAAIGVAALALAIGVPAVSAGSPSRVYLPISGPIELPAGYTCAFPVQIDVLVNQEYGVTFTDDAGNVVRQLISGRLIVRVTNTDNGHAMTLDISGPGEVVANADGTYTQYLRGNSLAFAQDVLWLTSGTTVVALDSSFSPTGIISQTGAKTDVCAALA